MVVVSPITMERTMKDVSHTSPVNEEMNSVYKRGTASEEEEE